MKKIGIVAGTVFLKEPLFDEMEPETVETVFGTATVFLAGNAVFLPRHGTDRNHYILPHLINHRANIMALKERGAAAIIGVHSTGSLKRDLAPGTIVIPHDFIALSPLQSVFHDRDIHVTPILDEKLRENLIAVADVRDRATVPSGVYWQTTGPRFETRAEIRMMANFADIVGMTMASEAIVSCELGLPYASLCSVDNYAHGVSNNVLSIKAVQEAARQNARRIAPIIKNFLASYS
jgi:5'-methylthioadenosine phosphorylase